MVEGDMSLDLLALSPKRTRLVLHSKVRPLTIAARLFLQSMKLAKGKMERKFETRIAQICHEIEERHRTAPRR